MIEQRAHAMKALCAEELFIVHAAVGLIMYNVPLIRYVSELMVERHLYRVVAANVLVCFRSETKFYQLLVYLFSLGAPFDLGGSIMSTTAKAFG